MIPFKTQQTVITCQLSGLVSKVLCVEQQLIHDQKKKKTKDEISKVLMIDMSINQILD